MKKLVVILSIIALAVVGMYIVFPICPPHFVRFPVKCLGSGNVEKCWGVRKYSCLLVGP
jgi:hypothetical protein